MAVLEPVPNSSGQVTTLKMGFSGFIILENIIRDFYLKQSKIDSELNKILKTTDFDEPFNIFTKSDNLDTFKNDLSEISFFPKSNTSWVGYDFNFSVENIYLTGITRISDSINGKISILKNIGASKTETDKIIPNSFSTFFTNLWASLSPP